MFSRITPDDWALLRSYAFRVKELRYQWSDLEDIGPCIIPILTTSFYANGASLLPRLQRLQMSDLNTQLTTCMIPLLSPTLQSVTVSFDVGEDSEDCPNIKDRDNFEMFISALRVASPSLSELEVLDQSRTFYMSQRHIDSISGFTFLQCFLSHITLNPSAWSQLGSLRSLQHLDISIRSSDLEWGSYLDPSDADTTPDSYSLALPNLRRFKLRGPHDTLAVFLDNLESPALQSFTCNVYSSPTPSALEDFLNQAKDKLPRTLRKLTLQSFSMSQPGATRYGQTVPINLQPLLPPLASLAGLEDLYLDFFELPIHVSDDAIRVLANGLPTLVSLALRYLSPSRYTAAPDPDTGAAPVDRRPTIGALIALATGCPHLARLQLVDIDVEAEAAKDIVVPSLDHKLRELEITAFRTRTQQGVFGFAEKVHRLFPHLVNVQSEGSWKTHGAGSEWNVAKAYLGFLQTGAERNNGPLTSDSVGALT